MITRKPKLVVLAILYAQSTAFSPFEPAQAVQHHHAYLFQRVNQCLASQHFCPGSNRESGCCSTDSTCATDDAGHIACCPARAVCTGALGGSAGTVTATVSPSNTQALVVSTSAPQSPLTATANANGVGNTVPNPYFPYIFLPTTYANADLCSSAFSSCRSEFSICTGSLGTGGNGVTVQGVGGGITAQPALGTVSAGSICSSLSTRACYNLGLGNCPLYGTGTTAGGGTFSAGNAAPTRCAQLYQVAVAVAVGVAGRAIG